MAQPVLMVTFHTGAYSPAHRAPPRGPTLCGPGAAAPSRGLFRAAVLPVALGAPAPAPHQEEGRPGRADRDAWMLDMFPLEITNFAGGQTIHFLLLVQGGQSARRPWLGCLGSSEFRYLTDSAWAYVILAITAKQLGNMVEHPKFESIRTKSSSCWNTL